MDLKELIKKIRIEKDYSVYDMADKLGYSHGLINQLELGNKNVTEKFLNKMIEVFPLYESQLKEQYYMEKIKDLPEEILKKLKIGDVKANSTDMKDYRFATYNFQTDGNGEINFSDYKETVHTLKHEIGKTIENSGIVIRITGDYLIPSFFNDDIVVFLKASFENWQKLDNKIIMVEIEKKSYIKKVIFENGEPYLHTFNERLYPKEKISEIKNIKYVRKLKYRLNINLDNFTL